MIGGAHVACIYNATIIKIECVDFNFIQILLSFTTFYLLLAIFANWIRHTVILSRLKRIGLLFRKYYKSNNYYIHAYFISFFIIDQPMYCFKNLMLIMLSMKNTLVAKKKASNCFCIHMVIFTGT